MARGFEFKWKTEKAPQKISTKTQQPDIWHNAVADAAANDPKVNLICFQAPPPIDTPSRLLNQAVYYVANDNPKAARKCILAINEYCTGWTRSSWDAKCWVKEEEAVQKRHPEERAKYNSKPMPAAFEIVKEFWETA
jgi:hypothetical protein